MDFGRSPLMFEQRQHRVDPKLQLAAYLAQSGANKQASTPLGALDKVASMALGGYMQGQAAEDQKQRQADYASTMRNAMTAGMGTPETPDAPGPNRDGSAGYTAPARAGDMNALARILAGNPDTADMGLQMTLQDAAEKRAGQREEASYRRREPLVKVMGPDGRGMYVRQSEAEGGEPFGAEGNSPATVQEYQYFSNLSPNQQALFLTMKRANPYLNLGGSMVQPNPIAPGQSMGGFSVGSKPETNIDQKTGRIVTVPGVPGGELTPNANMPGAGPVAAPGPAVTQLPPTRQDMADAEKAIAGGEYTLKLIDELVAHPGMSTVVGAPGITGIPAKMGMAIPGTDAAGFNARLEQIGGKQFLEAFEALKGAGAITNVEGDKATSSISRLQQTGQSEEEYKAAAEELKQIVRDGIVRAKTRMGGAPPTPPPPATATSVDYRSRYGLE